MQAVRKTSLVVKSTKRKNTTMKRNIILSLVLGIMAMFSIPTFAQDVVKGNVVDENGDPVIGASVVIVGQSGTGVITDLDGNYSIKAPKNAKLAISYIGYVTQTVKPGGKIQLKPDSQNLEEVVVVGYGSQKKAHLTGSVATVPMEDIRDISAGNLASTLDGMVNGLSVSGGDARPGESATMKIRTSSMIGDVGGKS